MVGSVKTTLQDELSSKGRAIINTLASSIQDTILNRDSSTVQSYIDQYRNVEGISFIIILDEKNTIVAHTFFPKVPDEYMKLTFKNYIKQKSQEVQIREEVLNNSRELVLEKPILNGLLGHIYIGMGIEKRESEIIRPLLKEILIMSMICISVGIFITGIFLNYILQPILKLSVIAENYATGDNSYEILPQTSEDEVGQLTKNFYLMIEKITKNTQGLEQEIRDRTEIINEQQLSLISISKMSALGEMAGGIAHEINTPLAIIGMKIELINESIDEGDFTVEECKKSLHVIKTTTDRIAKIVNGLRFFARDGSKLPMEMVDINLIIEDTFSFCKEKMHLQSINVSVVREFKGDSLFINCRAVEISQVLLNLINNSNDAIREQDIKWIKMVVTDGEKEVKISVIDSGLGIDKDIQEKMMKPFFTTKEVGKGTGLGLNISRGIIESHNGKLFIDNSSENTTFTIILPKILENT